MWKTTNVLWPLAQNADWTVEDHICKLNSILREKSFTGFNAQRKHLTGKIIISDTQMQSGCTPLTLQLIKHLNHKHKCFILYYENALNELLMNHLKKADNTAPSWQQ